MSNSQRLLVIGAHPDDCGIKAGGIAAKWVEAGRDVTFLSVTNGSAGHHEMDRSEVSARRRRETEAVAELLGIEYDVFDIPDGELEPTLEYRKQLTEYIRRIDPDLVLGSRPNDYHPDHRYTAQLVRDAAYMLIVPNFCPAVAPMDSNPVMGYVADGFDKPAPFEPDVVLDVDNVIDVKLDVLHCHESQMYEWLPCTFGRSGEVPTAESARREWLETDMYRYLSENSAINVADRYRDQLQAKYGERGAEIDHCEAVEISEYGRPLTDELRERLFFW